MPLCSRAKYFCLGNLPSNPPLNRSHHFETTPVSGIEKGKQPESYTAGAWFGNDRVCRCVAELQDNRYVVSMIVSTQGAFSARMSGLTFFLILVKSSRQPSPCLVFGSLL